MTKQFWVNNYFIDVNRNQIQHQQQATSIPPKALKVLEVLAAHAGELVSHETLMDIVWENSVVGPNTLQRAVAQLRKAFGDDSKKQAFIKTHAKKGYSLEANVRWESSSTEHALTPSNEQPKNSKHLIILAVIATILVALVLWPSAPTTYDRVTPLTASDEQEFNASYSPDGKYLVFNRYVGRCESHLWAKDLSNNQEERLSAEPGHYSQLSWSSDGSQLAFVLQSDCSAESEQAQQCWQLQTLDFAQAWNGNANNTLRYDCANIKTTHPTWLNDGRIALLQYPQPESKQPELVIYDAVSNSLSNVSHQHSGQIYSLDYSPQLGLLATVTIDNNNINMLRTLTTAGELKSESAVTRDQNHSVYARFPISFSPDGKHFLTAVAGQIYRLDLNGQLALIHSPSQSGLWAPSYHPSQNKVAVTLGSKDFDIGFLNTSAQQENIAVLSRSTSVEANAKFQPNGNIIAFISSRSGTRQLWLNDNGTTYQLTKFEQGLRSTRYDWSPDGKSLAVNVSNQIAIISLTGDINMIEAPIAISQIMPWTNQNYLLVTNIQGDKHHLHTIDITTNEVTDLDVQNVLWAAFIGDEQLIYVDQEKNFWRFANGESQAVSALNKKLFGDYLLLKNNVLHGIDAQDQLWKFDLNTNDLAITALLDKDITYISDIKDEQILATKFIGGRRELVELSQR